MASVDDCAPEDDDMDAGFDRIWSAWEDRWSAEFTRFAEADEARKLIEEELVAMAADQAQRQATEAASAERRSISLAAMSGMEDQVRQVEDASAQRRRAQEERRKQAAKERAERSAARFQKWEEPDKRPEHKPSNWEEQKAAGGAPPAPPKPKVSGASVFETSARQPRSIDEFEACWAHFEELAAKTGGRALRCDDVPWPTAFPTVSGVHSSDDSRVRRGKLRAALVRWHPDKWGKFIDRIDEKEKAQVMERVKEVTRRIISEKQRYS